MNLALVTRYSTSYLSVIINAFICGALLQYTGLVSFILNIGKQIYATTVVPPPPQPVHSHYELDQALNLLFTEIIPFSVF